MKRLLVMFLVPKSCTQNSSTWNILHILWKHSFKNSITDILNNPEQLWIVDLWDSLVSLWIFKNSTILASWSIKTLPCFSPQLRCHMVTSKTSPLTPTLPFHLRGQIHRKFTSYARWAGESSGASKFVRLCSVHSDKLLRSRFHLNSICGIFWHRESRDCQRSSAKHPTRRHGSD